MYNPKEEITKIGKLMYERRLTDTAGGNISVRCDNLIYLTPRYSGSRFLWNLTPEQICVINKDGNVIDGPSELTRESKVHLRIYKTFENVGAVIHAHPEYILIFASIGKNIPPVLEYTEKFGEIECISFSPAHSEELAKSIIEKIQEKYKKMKKFPIPVLVPKHGIFIAAENLLQCYDALERCEANARCIILSKNI